MFRWKSPLWKSIRMEISSGPGCRSGSNRRNRSFQIPRRQTMVVNGKTCPLNGGSANDFTDMSFSITSETVDRLLDVFSSCTNNSRRSSGLSLGPSKLFQSTTIFSPFRKGLRDARIFRFKLFTVSSKLSFCSRSSDRKWLSKVSIKSPDTTYWFWEMWNLSRTAPLESTVTPTWLRLATCSSSTVPIEYLMGSTTMNCPKRSDVASLCMTTIFFFMGRDSMLS
mmetsp:Transcript_140897/g.245510  ORF Transcript_140897/g.245510 Transcript_140897/m.245510 type:complete len:224 (+) Transcript_140897:4422-5093(+)